MDTFWTREQVKTRTLEKAQAYGTRIKQSQKPHTQKRRMGHPAAIQDSAVVSLGCPVLHIFRKL
jgi:hypothetical protein